MHHKFWIKGISFEIATGSEDREAARQQLADIEMCPLRLVKDRAGETDHMRYIEGRIIGKAMTALRALPGFAGVEVYGCGEPDLIRTVKRRDIMLATAITDRTEWVVSWTPEGAEGLKRSWVLLIHGNDADVISDLSCDLEDALEPAFALAEELG